MKAKWLGSLGVVLSVCVTGARADDVRWRPTAQTPPVVIGSTAAAPPAPAVSLGLPVAASAPRYGPPPAIADSQLRPAGFDASRPAVPTAQTGPIFRGQSEPPPPPPPGVPAVPGGPVGPAIPPIPTGPGGPASPVDPLCGPGCVDPMQTNNPWVGRAQQWFQWCGDWNRPLFQSDHCFDGFASPVSNPFWFEDPRALTEIRPIFIYQTSPSGSLFGNGNIEWFGTQIRLALTDNLSIVVHKLGGIWVQPAKDSPFPKDVGGFSEVTVGPKFTFLRLRDSQTVGAIGVAFDIPTGPNPVKQDTSSLTIRPYVSFAQAFGRTSFGTFDAMSVIGYNVGLGDRSSNFFTGLHLDYNVGNFNRIYPLIELNYTRYTSNGSGDYYGVPITQREEGRDLFNLGSANIKGHNDLSIAGGVRYKFTEWAQVGTAAEFPLLDHGDLMSFRWTIDFILRY